MLKIGEFAGLTGLSVKALRHYDETGALVPADVDDRSAYRLYAEGQVRAGVTIRALRDAGVPLPAVSAAIAGGEAEVALETHRARVLEQREREDRAFREAVGVLRALAASVAVGERSMPAQHFVGQVITVPVKRDLAGALGFPLKKRTDAPAPVPLKRKAVGVQRSATQPARQPYKDEWALTDAQYEDAIQVITSAMLSMERTPSVVVGKDEEELRDYILVMLNGTFQGTATGETFVRNGKADILVRVEDRHVFVGECKW